MARLALAWRSAGVERGDRVAILSENRPEWLLADYAILATGAVTVPIYTSLTPAQIEYVLSTSDARALVVSTPEFLRKIASLRGRLPHLKDVVLMDAAEGRDACVASFRDLIARGGDLALRDPDAFVRIAKAARPEDLASIIYTSGTTGPPKGVALTHANFVSNVQGTASRFELTPADRALSFLPLSHAFERTVDFTYFSRGVTIVHVGLEHLTDCLTAIRPTVFTGVPRLFEKARQRIEERVAAAGPFQRRLFAWARRVGRAAVLEPLLSGSRPSPAMRLRRAAADLLVMRRVRAGFGGRIRYAISGGTALPRDLLEYFLTLGFTITEGYGLTEASPIVTVNTPGRSRPFTTGPPIPDTEVRIAHDGEILVRGPGVMAGYYKDPEGTAAVLEDGWLHTGDLGTLDADGCLAITDRVKDLIITSGGKNVAPQPLEAALRSTGLVAQCVVMGDGCRFVSALIVPDRPALEALCLEAGISSSPIEAALAHPRVLEAFERAVADSMRDFAPYEQVKKFALLPGEFTIEGGEMTPTLKVRRRAVQERYRAEIEALYAEAATGRSQGGLI